MNILLFDVDGVLIEDGGYYAALIKTLDYFNCLLGAAPIVFALSDRDQFHWTETIIVSPYGRIGPYRQHEPALPGPVKAHATFPTNFSIHAPPPMENEQVDTSFAPTLQPVIYS